MKQISFFDKTQDWSLEFWILIEIKYDKIPLIYLWEKPYGIVTKV